MRGLHQIQTNIKNKKMGHKNDYSVIVFITGILKPKKWEYVHTLYNFSKFLDKNHPEWLYMNVYDRRTAKFIQRFYKGMHIPPHTS